MTLGGMDAFLRAHSCKIKTSINITKSKEKLFKSALEWEQQFFYANGTKIYQFNAKDPKIKPYPLCLGNISKYFLLDNMTKRKHG